MARTMKFWKLDDARTGRSMKGARLVDDWQHVYLIVSFDFVDRLPLGQCYGCTLADQTEVIEVDVAVKCHVWNVFAIWIRSTLVLVLVLSSSSSSSLIASSTTAMRFMTTYSDPRTAQVHPLARHDDEDSKHGGHE